MPWSYNKATDTLTVTGGTPASPITLDDFDGELDISADPIVIKDWTVVPVGGDEFSPDAQPVFGGNLAVRLYGEKQDSPPFSDYLRVVGRDAWEILATSSINAGGLPQYLGPFRQAEVDFISADNTGGASWRCRVIQRHVQRVTKAADGSYVVHCNLQIGNGTDATYLASIGELVRFDTGKTYEVKDQAELEVAALPGDTRVGWWPPSALAPARRGMIYIGPWQ